MSDIDYHGEFSEAALKAESPFSYWPSRRYLATLQRLDQVLEDWEKRVPDTHYSERHQASLGISRVQFQGAADGHDLRPEVTVFDKDPQAEDEGRRHVRVFVAGPQDLHRSIRTACSKTGATYIFDGSP